MAFKGNVYGTPITDETLTNLPAFRGKVISKRDRAQMAMYYISSENKDNTARQRAEELARQGGSPVSTLCLIYNATGDAIKLSGNKVWEGHFGSDCPKEIANGQWGVFVHVNGATSPSEAAIVYRGKNANGVEHDWMLVWDNKCNDCCLDKVYTEVGEVNRFANDGAWITVNSIVTNLKSPVIHHQNKNNECMSTVTIRNYTSPMVEAVFLVT